MNVINVYLFVEMYEFRCPGNCFGGGAFTFFQLSPMPWSTVPAASWLDEAVTLIYGERHQGEERLSPQ